MADEGTETRVIRTVGRCVHLASAAVVAIGLAVAIGWFLDIPLLKSVSPKFISMKLNTALCFVLAGAALWCLQNAHIWQRRLGMVLAGAVSCVGALSLSQYVFGVNLGIDNLIVQETPSTSATTYISYLGRMSAITAVEFLLVGMSLLLLNSRVGWCLLASQLFALVVVFLSLLELVGYLYELERLYSFGEYSAIALYTVVAFLFLGLGTVAARPHCYIMKHITSDALGAVAARHMLPFAIFVPILLGWLHVQWQSATNDEWQVGTSVEIICIILIFVAQIIWFARSLDRTDIARHRFEEEKRAADRRMQVVGKALIDAVMDWNLMTSEVWLSESFYAFFGYSPKSTNPSIEFWKSALHPDDRERVLADLSKFIGDGQESCSCEYRFRRKNGGYVHVLGRGYLLRDVAGSPIHFICAMIDVTKQKRAEETRREREAMENRYQFISTVSHELRSPLTVIQNGIEMVADGVDGPVTEEQKAHLNMSLHHLNRLNRLVSDILDFQKMETGRMPVHNSLRDINAIAAVAANGFRDEAQKKGIALDVQLDSGVPKVVCDPDAVEQVMTNLLSNAIKYSDHGHITLKTARNGGGEVQVSVSDEGIGITKEDQARLFNSFFRVEAPGKPRTEGTGLGLAICKKIIDACHGKIGVASEPGHGSTFYFTLPIIQK